VAPPAGVRGGPARGTAAGGAGGTGSRPECAQALLGGRTGPERCRVCRGCKQKVPPVLIAPGEQTDRIRYRFWAQPDPGPTAHAAAEHARDPAHSRNPDPSPPLRPTPAKPTPARTGPHPAFHPPARTHLADVLSPVIGSCHKPKTNGVDMLRSGHRPKTRPRTLGPELSPPISAPSQSSRWRRVGPSTD
jgi:hypothetical protein